MQHWNIFRGPEIKLEKTNSPEPAKNVRYNSEIQ